MFASALFSLYVHELLKIKDEIALYPNEPSLWTLTPGTANSGGNLCFHLIGNLTHLLTHLIYHLGQVNHHRRMRQE